MKGGKKITVALNNKIVRVVSKTENNEMRNFMNKFSFPHHTRMFPLFVFLGWKKKELIENIINFSTPEIIFHYLRNTHISKNRLFHGTDVRTVAQRSPRVCKIV